MAIIVPITSTWDGKGFDKAIREIKRAEGSFQKFSVASNILSASLIDTGKSLTRNVTVPLAALSVAINKSITDASNLAEAQSKVNAVFKNQAREIQAWAKTTSTAFGVSQRQALEAAGTYGNLFQAFGIGQKESVGMSKRLVELAADMASFNNVPIDEALTALRSGLSGETEPLKRFGVALNDVRLRQEAAALGLGTYSGMLPVAVKAQAAYALILKDTALQQGDVARTAGGLANQKKFLAAQVEDLSGSFGAVFTPIMINLVGVLRNSVLPQIQRFIEAFKTLSPEAVVTGIKIALFTAALGPALIMVGYLVRGIKLLGDAFMFLTKRIVFIPTVIALIIAAFIKGNDASMSWGDALFKLARGLVIGFVQIGNAVSSFVNLLIKGYNKFQEVLGSGVRIQEWGNMDFLIRGVDDARAAFGKFSSELSKNQQDMSAIVAEAKLLGEATGGSTPSSAAGGADKATKAFEAFQKRLEQAKDTLAEAKSRFDEFARSISGAIKSVLNFGSAATAETGTFLENLISQADKAKEFGKRISELIRLGLSERAITQVLDAGAEAGIKIADEIIAGGSTIVTQVNELVAATETLADQVGTLGADAFYSAGIKQGQALVDGVISAIKAAGFTIDENGNIVNPAATTGITGGLGTAPTATAPVSAPSTRQTTPSRTSIEQQASRIANKLSRITPRLANGGIVTNPTLATIGEAGPEAVIPLNKLGQGGATYNITVNAGIGTDGAAVGRQIVDAIKRFERSSGPVFASA
jgi:hypothetical protein